MENHCFVIVFVLSFELSILASRICHSTLPVLNSACLTAKRQQSQKQPSQQRNQKSTVTEPAAVAAGAPAVEDTVAA